ncbi:hypothetical protein CSB45_06655 [candidate division KSB3 bacterium]|uniref:Uncharacterized protein n=1 Tax=candidate division KSB3 bacterium TaxID=2044937 RepID=A0A2G6E5Z1_9BACT|nr:MAG: hypothetical protein CSB45_06655 [candidate division KSB3 bacterium]PIE30085.1 MAG: hypothetical protein CSA57_05940 [candidate division KSB3 bacterium]
MNATDKDISTLFRALSFAAEKHRRNAGGDHIEHAESLSFEARQVKIADNISNSLDISRDPPSDWSLPRQRDDLNWGQELVDRIRGSNATLEQHFDHVLQHARERLGDEDRYA